MSRGTEPSVIAFVGDSDAGKTTLLERPIPRLVLLPPDRMPRREHREAGPVLRVIRVPESAPEEKPVFSDDLVHSIASGIVGWFQRHPISDREGRAPVAVSGFHIARSTPRGRIGRSR